MSEWVGCRIICIVFFFLVSVLAFLDRIYGDWGAFLDILGVDIGWYGWRDALVVGK